MAGNLCLINVVAVVSAPLWQANSGDSETSSVLQDVSNIQSNTNGTKVLIGPVFTTQIEESLSEIALRFGTSIKTLLKFNSDLVESAVVQSGQHICVLPCKR
jgi:hypothetical protein